MVVQFNMYVVKMGALKKAKKISSQKNKQTNKLEDRVKNAFMDMTLFSLTLSPYLVPRWVLCQHGYY